MNALHCKRKIAIQLKSFLNDRIAISETSLASHDVTDKRFFLFLPFVFSLKFVLFSIHSRSEFIRVVEENRFWCVLQPSTTSSVPLLTRTQWLDWIRLFFAYSLHKYLNGQMPHPLPPPQLFTSLNSTRIDRSETCNRTTHCLVNKKWKTKLRAIYPIACNDLYFICFNEFNLNQKKKKIRRKTYTISK